MAPPKRILVITTEFAVDANGTYRPGGLQLFSRAVVASLVGAPGLEAIEAWGLLDSPEGMKVFQAGLRDPRMAVKARGFRGSRAKLVAAFARNHWAFDLVIFLHIRVGVLAVLRGSLRVSCWLVGIEVRRRLGKLERFAVKRSRPLLSISKYSSDEMVRYNPDLQPGLPVHLSVEQEASWSHVDQPAAELGYDPKLREPAVLIVARLAASERYKGHDQLIEAWPSVLQTRADAELWITGTGDDEDRLKTKAASLGVDVASKIKFLGRVSHEKLIDLYRTARVFAMPSTGEGFGLVFCEAMRFGLPCICSFDSAAEIVVNNETGFVVDQDAKAIASACSTLLRDDQLATRMGAAGQRRFLDHFQFDGMRRRVREAYGFLS